VHSPLVGPFTWQPVADELEQRGARAVVPSLLDATTGPGPAWERQVAAVVDAVEAAGIERPVLAGHSGAGPLLPTTGAALGAVAAYVFVDAALPTGEGGPLAALHPSLRARLESLAQDGMLPPWNKWWGPTPHYSLLPDEETRERFVSELRPVPLSVFEEPLPPVPDWPDAPCAYLRLSDAYRDEEAEAARRGWPVTRLEGSHLELLLRPTPVVDALLALTAGMGAGT
jgi:hypothetical protein